MRSESFPLSTKNRSRSSKSSRSVFRSKSSSPEDRFDAGNDIGVAAHSGTRESAAHLIPITVSEMPLIVKSLLGDTDAFAIDYHVSIGTLVIVSGWIIGPNYLANAPETLPITGAKVCLFPRPDVEAAFPDVGPHSTGFVAVIEPRADGSLEFFEFRVHIPADNRLAASSDRLWNDHANRTEFLLSSMSGRRDVFIGKASQLEHCPPDYKGAVGFVEHAKCVPDCGGLVIGWVVTLPDVTAFLIDDDGKIIWLGEEIRWHRNDIVEAFSSDFGNYTFNAGFLQACLNTTRVGGRIRLGVVDGHRVYILSEKRWEQAPGEATSFARWAFDFPTPMDRFGERMQHHDASILEALLARKKKYRSSLGVKSYCFGEIDSSPTCSIIIPLYGRFDFMKNQFIGFSEDEFVRSKCEIIYVVDDPRIASSVIQEAQVLHSVNRFPFQVVTYGSNLGFSGANNVGVGLSRAPCVLLLNSDVIPVEPGWLEKMLASLGNSNAGLVGARLLFPNGSIQHDGMDFVWEPNWGAFLNKHPRAGLEPLRSPADHTVTPPIVTAACLLVTRRVFDAVGGLDEGFLIGDFEDSDFCLKVHELGLDVRIVRDVHLVHLERQSFAGIGADRFREQVARFNAWRHQRRWGSKIESIVNDASNVKRGEQ